MSAGDQWRSEILDGVTKVDFPGCAPGSIKISGETAEAIIANDRGQVLCAAGELGKGRIIVFAHDVFVRAFQERRSDFNKHFLDNIAKWITKGKGDNDRVIASLQEFLTKRNEVQPEGNILTWDGVLFPSENQLKRLIRWISEGGGLICGTTPWGVAGIFNINVGDLPLNYVFDRIGLAYAGLETFENKDYILLPKLPM